MAGSSKLVEVWITSKEEENTALVPLISHLENAMKQQSIYSIEILPKLYRCQYFGKTSSDQYAFCKESS